jgi:NAD(P)H-flavin reductase
LGRRLLEVAFNRPSGGYRLISLLDPEGPEPEPGQFYMLATERSWGEGGDRPYLPRALSVADAIEGRLDYLLEGIGPGTDRLCAVEEGERVWVNGPLGNAFSAPREVAPAAAGAILVGGGIGVAPLALLRRRLAARGVPTQILLGFRDRHHSGGIDDLFSNCQLGLASDDGHLGERGYVTELLAAMLEGDDAANAAVYACGPPPMLEAVRAMCATRGAACELALESPMACGFGACFGCAVPLAEGGYMRLCVDGPVVRGELVAEVPHP